MKINIYTSILLVTILSGVMFNLSHSIFHIDMLKSENNRFVLLLPYYFVTILLFIFFIISKNISKNISKKVSLTFLVLVTSLFVLIGVFFKTNDFGHIKRVLINIIPFLFYFSLIADKKVDKKCLLGFLKFTFYLSAIIAFLQITLITPIHDGRVNGIFQGPNSYAMFLLGCSMVFIKLKDYKLLLLSFFLILLTKSSSALLITLLALGIVYFNVKFFILLLLFFLGLIYWVFEVYTVGSDMMIDKILIITDFLSNLSIHDIYYLSNFDSAFKVDNVSNEIISPLNRLIQINYYFFNTSFFEFVFGSNSPRFYESILLILLSNLGLFGLVILYLFYNKAKRKVKYEPSNAIFKSMFFMSLIALPTFTISFSSWFVMISIYLSLAINNYE